MKLFLSLVLFFSLGSLAKSNEYQRGFSRSRTCTRNEYREEYIPGTRESPGYVHHWTEVIEVPCDSINHSRKISGSSNSNINNQVDNNDCKEGSFIGALLGAGLTLSGTRGKDRWWAVPAGGAAGAMIGCQLDGG